MNFRLRLATTLLLVLFSISLLVAEDKGLAPTYGKKGVWYKAHLTWYESYPDEGSEEYVKFSGGEYLGTFAFLDYRQSRKWVEKNNIIAVHNEHGKWLSLEKLQLRLDPKDEDSEILATVYDVCADSDCSGCCTRNARETGYLIDLEIHTLRRMGFTKDHYPKYIYFKIYETQKQEARRVARAQRKEERRRKREKK